jgi:tetratricopeptide (TPR) repeat protein
VAFSYCFWNYAVVAEVYSLNTFFIALIILITLYLRERRKRTYLYLLAFIFGLGIGNHYTIILLLPALLLFILLERPCLFKIETALLAIFFLLTGLSVFLYLPIRSLTNPPMDFCNPETLKDFIRVILRLPYPPLEIAHSGKQFLSYFGAYTRSLDKQFTFFLMWLGIPGILIITRKDPRLALFSLLNFYAYSLGIIFLSGSGPVPPPLEDTQRIALYSPSYLIYGLWMGVAAAWLGEKLSRLNKNFFYTVILIPLFALKANYFENDKSKYTFAYDYGMGILESLEPGAVLLTTGDQPIFILYYLHYVEAVRPDVALLSGGLLSSAWYREEVRYKYPFIENALEAEKNEVLAFSEVNEINRIANNLPSDVELYCSTPDLIKIDYLLPHGFIYRLKKEKASDPLYPEGLLDNIRNWQNKRVYKDKDVRDCFTYIYNNLCYYFFKHGLIKEALKADIKALEITPLSSLSYFYLGWCYQSLNEFDMAIKAYKMSLRLGPQQVKVHNNLGLVYVMKNDYPSAAMEFKEALKIDPQYKAARVNLSKIKQHIP